MIDNNLAMRRLVTRALVLTVPSIVFCPVPAWAAEPVDDLSNDKAIRATAAAFVEAFNRGSAKDVAALWTENGSLVDEQGEVVKGRAAIEAKYAAFFKQDPVAKIKVTVQSIEFPTAVVAVEDGIAEITSEHAGPPAASRYAAVHTRADGKWLMASVRESTINVPSNFAHLQSLEWLIGRWKAESDNVVFESSFRWIANKSFIQREYTTTRAGSVLASGTQLIGWDSSSARVRSWSFDTAGGHGTGYWFETSEGYRIQSAGVRGDGTPTRSFECLIEVPLEHNVFGWQSVDRRIGGVEFPNTPEIVFDKMPEN